MKNSKFKGNIGETKVLADLTKRGFGVALPHGDNLPFDLIAVDENLNLLKVQVKYSAKRNGKIILRKQRVTGYVGKIHTTTYGPNDVDLYAIYCPDNDVVYYVSAVEINDRVNSFELRIDESRAKSKNINWANNYLKPKLKGVKMKTLTDVIVKLDEKIEQNESLGVKEEPIIITRDDAEKLVKLFTKHMSSFEEHVTIGWLWDHELRTFSRDHDWNKLNEYIAFENREGSKQFTWTLTELRNNPELGQCEDDCFEKELLRWLAASSGGLMDRTDQAEYANFSTLYYKGYQIKWEAPD